MTEKKAIINPDASFEHDKQNYYIKIDLPGVKKEGIELGGTEQSLCVKATRDDAVLTGCYSLAHPIDVSKAKAKFDNGLLNITIPLKQSLAGTKIKVE